MTENEIKFHRLECDIFGINKFLKEADESINSIESTLKVEYHEYMYWTREEYNASCAELRQTIVDTKSGVQKALLLKDEFIAKNKEYSGTITRQHVEDFIYDQIAEAVKMRDSESIQDWSAVLRMFDSVGLETLELDHEWDVGYTLREGLNCFPVDVKEDEALVIYKQV